MVTGAAQRHWPTYPTFYVYTATANALVVYPLLSFILLLRYAIPSFVLLFSSPIPSQLKIGPFYPPPSIKMARSLLRNKKLSESCRDMMKGKHKKCTSYKKDAGQVWTWTKVWQELSRLQTTFFSSFRRKKPCHLRLKNASKVTKEIPFHVECMAWVWQDQILLSSFLGERSVIWKWSHMISPEPGPEIKAKFKS